MKRLSRDNHVFALDPRAQPAITVSSGEELVMETWDAFLGNRNPNIASSTPPLGPATGPIAIKGAQPGDALRVDVLAVKVLGDALHVTSLVGVFCPRHSTKIASHGCPWRTTICPFPVASKFP